ncbi:hypothetical protein J2X07_002985 [Fictibacillus barbaricus]|uniref:Phosphatase n=1 Tax=Fictibacillus barbaricus TaxID=182136 RepID=A0ABU1U3E8_9BACL|nr:hypothetical protein [Fictibacillus barbaricus]
MKKLLKLGLLLALILSISLSVPSGSIEGNDREDPPSPIVKA